MKKHVDVWAGAPAKSGYTQQHTPLLWENMLGTVYALKHGDDEAEYFDYDYEAAHAHIGLDGYEDLRVCRVKYSYQGWPRQGKWALFGVRKVPHTELFAELDRIEAILAEGSNSFFERHRRVVMKKLLDRQMKDFSK